MYIEYIKEFIILAEILNFSKASKVLHISQPTLSRHLSSIEEDVGACLIVRTNHQAVITDAGILFLETAKEIVENYESAIYNIGKFQNARPKQLRLGVLYYQKDFFLDSMGKFNEKYPDTCIEYITGTPGELISALLNNEIDICATMNIKFKGAEKLKFKNKYTEPFIIMVGKHHRLADRTSINVEELKNEVFINVADVFYDGYYENIRNLCRKHGVELPAPVLVPDYEDMLLSVQADKGIAILTLNMKNHLSNCRLLSINEPDFIIARSIAWKKNSSNLAVTQFVSDF